MKITAYYHFVPGGVEITGMTANLGVSSIHSRFMGTIVYEGKEYSIFSEMSGFSSNILPLAKINKTFHDEIESLLKTKIRAPLTTTQ